MQASASPSPWFRTGRRRQLAKQGGLGLVAVVLLCMAANLWMVSRATSRIFPSPAATPYRATGLLLGTDPIMPDGATNLHFLSRTRTAAELVAQGKVGRLIVSGHPDNRGYNEARGMAAELVRLGVPPDRLELDEGGRRTWHSLVNARHRWGLTNCTLITDPFHGPRALFLADQAGLHAVACCVPASSANFWSLRSQLREWFARLWAFQDVLRARFTPAA